MLERLEPLFPPTNERPPVALRHSNCPARTDVAGGWSDGRWRAVDKVFAETRLVAGILQGFRRLKDAARMAPCCLDGPGIQSDNSRSISPVCRDRQKLKPPCRPFHKGAIGRERPNEWATIGAYAVCVLSFVVYRNPGRMLLKGDRTDWPQLSNTLTLIKINQLIYF